MTIPGGDTQRHLLSSGCAQHARSHRVRADKLLRSVGRELPASVAASIDAVPSAATGDISAAG